MRKILILGASDLQLPTIKKAKEMGVETYVADYNPEAIGAKFADFFFCVSTLDKEAILKIARDNCVDGIMTAASDRPMTVVAYVASCLGLPGVSEETAFAATNKAQMRKSLANYNIPIPEFHIAKNYEEYLKISKTMKIPFIVKPSDNSGSRGIYLVEDQNQIEEAYKHSIGNTISGVILVEEFMTGPEVSVETITSNGITTVLAVTDKITTGAPFFVELGHTEPSQLDKTILSKIENVAKLAVKALGIDNSPSHVEMKVTPEGPKIVELGARMGGDCITSHLVPLSTGISMIELSILLALGQKIVLPEKKNQTAIIRYFPQLNKRIRKISVPKEIDSHIKAIEILAKEGDVPSVVDSSSSRIGYAIIQGQSLDICEKVWRDLLNSQIFIY